MALSQAQLGQVPYMQLMSRPQAVEPAWHKALAAFLVNTASSTGKGLADNVMSQDYSEQAAAAGVPGASAEKQAFLDKLLRGPRMDKEGLRAGMRDVTEGKRNELQDRRYQDQLNLQERQFEETKAENVASRTSREKIAGETAALRKEEGQQRAFANSQAAQDRLERILDSRRAQEERAPLTAAQVEESKARTGVLKAGGNVDEILARAYAKETGESKAKTEAFRQRMIELGILPPGSSLPVPGGKQPTDNSSSFDARNTGPTPSVPGGKPVVRPGGESEAIQNFIRGLNDPKTTPVPMPSATSTSGSNPNAAPSAGTSAQMGQSAAMTPEGNLEDYEDEPITQEQPMEQHTGEAMGPSDILALVRPAQTPNSPTNIGASTTGANPQPVPMSPETYRLAAEFARRMGLAPGMGGTPGQAGSGGLPLGYG
jgi:hypothetical protein